MRAENLSQLLFELCVIILFFFQNGLARSYTNRLNGCSRCASSPSNCYSLPLQHQAYIHCLLPKAALNDTILFASHAFARTRSICLLFVLWIISKTANNGTLTLTLITRGEGAEPTQQSVTVTWGLTLCIYEYKKLQVGFQ